MTNAIIKVHGGPISGATLLGQSRHRIPTAGKIRAGIKVLSRTASEQPRACEIYERGVAAGESFDQIERLLVEALPKLRNPLVPRNVAWFTVRSQDFDHPAIAQQLLDTHGEDKGEGRHLYRLPVVFPSDHWQTVMPHELAAWGASERRYWSEYSPDGRVRHCMCHAPVPLDTGGKRALRLFGGRKTVVREDNGGICDPEACREYQAGQCNLSGRFLFFVPGIRSLSAFELHTSSFYAMNAAIQKFETISFLRGGRISGFLDSQRTPFYLSKKLMQVAHIDEQGRAVRVPQWIIDLEAPIDVAALLREKEDADTPIVQAHRAAQMLEESNPSSDAEPYVADAVVPKAVGEGEPTLSKVLAFVEGLGIPGHVYGKYADRQWGAGWKLNPHGRRRAWDDLERHRNDPSGLRDRVETAARGVA